MKTASTTCTMAASSPGAPPPSNSSSQPGRAGEDGVIGGLAPRIEQLVEERLQRRPGGLEGVAARLAAEVNRICHRSDRIQSSGDVQHWAMALVRHRVDKCLTYYEMGSRRGRVELHSNLSAIVYRHVAPKESYLSFQGRYALIEDFMQIFYIEVLNAFRREHQLPATYTPRTQLELAEYMAFSEQYAKRRITLPGRHSQQLIVLRAQSFSRRQPAETSVDMGLVSDGAKSEEAETYARSSLVQEVRDKLKTDAYDPGAAVMRDRVIATLVDYFKAQNQTDCIDYLVLKLEDCSAAEIDEILGLSPRQRDYLQQRFKYHVEKFAQQHEWALVHQWLGANLEDSLGMTPEEWQGFLASLPVDHRRLIDLKRQTDGADQGDEDTLARCLGWTSKKVHRTWSQVLKQAWDYRNQSRRDGDKS
ncbi:hypothetical protein [Leptolyngbya sp. BL0902]|uniref:hypothetical protein n=1 Tax=Leptolyngbya sp. BL0902 TaxID=1115757 RepID=UPI001CECC17E|nr:hypothetical protein [Leptolyngbya sp. BL0902]